MTPQQKVVLVESAKDRYGLNVALTTVGLPKSTWYYHEKDKVDYESAVKVNTQFEPQNGP